MTPDGKKFQLVSGCKIPELLGEVVSILNRVPVEDASEPSDPELVERARGGEREAFGFLYRRHQAYVYRFARAMTGSPALAEDIVQEVFLALMRDLERYDASRAGLRTYLFGIARNLARYKARSVRRLISLDHAEEAAAIRGPGRSAVREPGKSPLATMPRAHCPRGTAR